MALLYRCFPGHFEKPVRAAECQSHPIVRKFLVNFRSSRPEVFSKKRVHKNFAKFTGKHLCQGLFFNKAAGLRMQFIKKRPWYRCFPVNFAEFLGAPFILEHLVKYSNGCSLQKLFNSTVMFRTNYLGECYGLCRI